MENLQQVKSSLIENSLTHISLSTVRKNCDNAFVRSKSLRDFPRSDGRSPGGPTSQNSFGFGQFANCGAGFVIHHHHYFVRQGDVEDLRDKIPLSYSFNFLWAG